MHDGTDTAEYCMLCVGNIENVFDELGDRYRLVLVSKLFIDNANIYCFRRGLPVSAKKHVYQYCQLMYNVKLTLKIF